MGMINISSNDKDIELISLEAHVALCKQRQKSLEGKVDAIIDNHKLYKRIFLSAAVTLVTGGLSGLTALIIHASNKL